VVSIILNFSYKISMNEHDLTQEDTASGTKVWKCNKCGLIYKNKSAFSIFACVSSNS